MTAHHDEPGVALTAAEREVLALRNELREVKADRVVLAEELEQTRALARECARQAESGERERDTMRRLVARDARDEMRSWFVIEILGGALLDGADADNATVRSALAEHDARVRREALGEVLRLPRHEPKIAGWGEFAGMPVRPDGDWIAVEDVAALAGDAPKASGPAGHAERMDGLRPTCPRCRRWLVRGAVGGGHFDWLECPDCAKPEGGR